MSIPQLLRAPLGYWLDLWIEPKSLVNPRWNWYNSDSHKTSLRCPVPLQETEWSKEVIFPWYRRKSTYVCLEENGNTETLKCILNTFLKSVFFDAISFDSDVTPRTSEFTVHSLGILLIVAFYGQLLIFDSKTM